MMKKYLLALNHGYYFWATSIYVGLLWSLHFIFSSSWENVRPDQAAQQFMMPVDSATRFFTVVVPPMLLSGLILLVVEWKTRQRNKAIAAYACLWSMMVVGGYMIRPINEWVTEQLQQGSLQADALRMHLQDWMFYNDVRMIIMTTLWLILLWYFYSKNNLLDSLVEKE